MDWLNIHKLAELVGKSKKTVERRIKELEKNQPELAKTLTQKGGWGNKHFYSPEILNHIGGLHRAIVEEVEREIMEGPTTKGEPKKSRKDKPIKIISIGTEDEKAYEHREKLDAIFDELRVGDLSLTELCASHNVRLHEFYNWVDSYPDMRARFDDIYEEYKRNSHQLIRDLAVMQLKKSMIGYNVELKSQSYEIKISPTGDSIKIPTREVTYQKHVTPGRDLLQFALTNREPDEWKRLMALTKGNDGSPNKEDIFSKMSDEQLIEYADQARAKGFLPAKTE